MTCEDRRERTNHALQHGQQEQQRVLGHAMALAPRLLENGHLGLARGLEVDRS